MDAGLASVVPGGHYEIDGVTHETYKDFPYGWSRMVRVFREGYRYQRGRACPYNFSWRPQLIFSVHDADGNVVPHERMWPNHVRDWVIPHDVVIHGVTVLPAGPIGAQADLLCLSWHDSSRDDVRGSSATAPGNNWGQILAGYSTHWGLQAAADFARSRGVRLCMPEWAPRRGPGDASTHPGDVIRFSHELFRRNRDVLSYENVFDQGSGDLDAPWVPAQPRAEEPGTVYRALWHR